MPRPDSRSLLAFGLPSGLALVGFGTGVLGDPIIVLPVAAVTAGVVSGAVARGVLSGLVATVAGAALASFFVGAVAVYQKVSSCADGCTGMSSPNFTAIFVVILGVASVIVAAIAYLFLQGVRRLAARQTA
jgi:hypothetical protein